MKNYAHSGPAGEVNGDLPDGQLLADHLRGVAGLAAGMAAAAAPAAGRPGDFMTLRKYRPG